MKNKTKLPAAILLLFGIFFLLIIIFVATQKITSYDLRSRAEDPDPNFCQNNCKDPTCRGLPDFYDAGCCEEIAKTGDPTACPWPQRGWCMPEHCSTIPEGVSRERCAAPRQAWCNLCKENKCPGYVDTPKPTTPPPVVPTQKPTSGPPTAKPKPAKPLPTLRSNVGGRDPDLPNVTSGSVGTTQIQPKIINVFESPTPTSVPFKLNFRFPRITVNLTEINRNTKKPLGFFEYAYKTIVSYDKKLEEWVNTRIGQILRK